MINNQRLDELYKEWRGNSHIEDSCHPVLSSEEAQDFAQYCTNEETNYLRTQLEEANRRWTELKNIAVGMCNAALSLDDCRNRLQEHLTPPEEEVEI